ncbi:hypothetical protein PHLGIDRAFT_22648 [Phlebiopsis gigantea 11061_1 CR5-6]|uniref:Wax synthase domain-containing protein n=1 Tax=Phlebiopsis gigantea (strain 11061_1 CR5-6) TaxID=745531 RepID=A0A0C3NWQ4_PHLG1|nr:hypothetical protein PHLGIDRAFT_22648 [Phlebiopsis gigantea 11061_1 CR5-6]
MDNARPPFDVFTYHVIPVIIVAFFVARRPSFVVRLGVLGSLAAVHLYSLRFDTGETYRNYSTGTALGTLWFSTFHLLLLIDTMAEYRHETQKGSLVELPMWQRVYSALCIITNVRGIGWNYQIEHSPPLPRHTRLQFIVSRALRIAWYTLLTDITQVFISLNPIFWLPEDQAQSLRAQGLALSVINIVAFMARSYSTLNMGYDLMALVSVALGLSEPKYWPVSHGKWRDAYTIRRFWGRTWHQWLRRFVSNIAKFVARTLGLAKGTWLSSHVQLFVGFVVSGLAHVPGDIMVHPKYTGCSFWFFPSQAVAITLEDFVVARAKQLGIRDASWTRLVGYAWTFAWFAYTTPWFIDWAVKSGQAREKLLPFSIINPSREGVDHWSVCSTTWSTWLAVDDMG